MDIQYFGTNQKIGGVGIVSQSVIHPDKARVALRTAERLQLSGGNPAGLFRSEVTAGVINLFFDAPVSRNQARDMAEEFIFQYGKL